jgi:hypothetical protein
MRLSFYFPFDFSPNSETLSPIPDNPSFLLVVKIQQFRLEVNNSGHIFIA